MMSPTVGGIDRAHMWPNSHCKAYVDEKFHALKKSKRWEKRKKKKKKNSLSKSIQIHEPGGQRLELVTFGFMNYSIHHCSPGTSHQTWPEYARTICRFGPPEALSPQVFAAFSHR
ncbi:hypothetical protein FOCG_12202 [Fusarium oxysporum f. sp. radicis-lycopersici 26381]|nr:hypothetical protein FOCG_12202 [Fusarium oxysporum f. sp. radicis-lycopersici 26381]